MSQRITPPHPIPGGQFARNLAIDGNLLAVGEHALPMGGVPAVGAIHVYERLSSTQPWEHVATLRPAEPKKDLQLGVAVAVSGTTIAGGTLEDLPDAPNAGAAITFERGVDWQGLPGLMPPDAGVPADVGGPENIHVNEGYDPSDMPKPGGDAG